MFVQGVGSLLAVHFGGRHYEILKALFYHHMLDQGIFIARRGFITLSIETKDRHVEQFMRALVEFVDNYRDFLVQNERRDNLRRWQGSVVL
ncbi:hypothetical protein PV10_08256 [Exophiala mesophila]|uniref:Uncharacterized protein n=1 Tax=Exophiala mesophila TaxID=212818 RepID=A0A0D1XK78_EXOME|nr:uncharacterized protein PV10_08256 [Exophiala mesophila]KIV88586.1 hypothetical protein PV10_08256 [Exophiala mesophila]